MAEVDRAVCGFEQNNSAGSDLVLVAASRRLRGRAAGID